MTTGSTVTTPRPRPTARAGSATRTRASSATRTRASSATRTGASSGRRAATATAAAPALPRRTAAPAPRPQLRVVESPAERQRRVLRTRRAVVFGTLITAIAVFAIVAFHVMLAQGQVRLARLQSELSGAERDYQQARYAHARAESPERIISKATEIGLVTPERPPVAVAVPDPAAPSADGTNSQTLDGYTHVKTDLADGP